MRSRSRALLLFLVVGLGFCAVILRAVQFQVRPDPRLVSWAKSKTKLANTSQQEDLITSRGAILDRNERELALSIVTKSFFANPKLVKNPDAVARRLSPLLKVPSRKLAEQLKQDRFFVWLKREVEDGVASQIEALNIEGVYSRKESKRVYPGDELGRALIGSSGRDGVGLEGLEKQYDARLRSSDRSGNSGVRDALGRLLLFNDFEKEWFDSYHIVTTVDSRIQRIMEDELRSVLKEKKAASAQAVMMNPKTGEILAMASLDGDRPDRDPARNRVITDVFEPGSTFKIILAAAALEHLQMGANSQIFGENGSFRVGNRTIREYHSKKFGWLTLQELLEISSNIASAKLGLKLGNSNLHSVISKFGFGAKSGIDFPGEESGLVRSPSQWKPIELANISFGQGIGVTPLQLVRAVSAIANGGVMVKPHLVSKIIAPESARSEPKVVWTPSLESEEILSASKARALTDMLIHVTDVGSTGTAAAIPGYQVAGKTGTAQKLVETKNARGRLIKTYSSKESVVSFVGYVPAYDPAFVLLVVYDGPKGMASGGTLAAPSFKRIASKSLAILGVPMASNEEPQQPVKRAKVVEGTRFVGREFQDVLKEVKAMPAEERAKFDLVGYGTAVREEISDEEKVTVFFE
jgi:cell division protein FtsI (penicillin-binding protein 3)